jgi:hypothetical protein
MIPGYPLLRLKFPICRSLPCISSYMHNGGVEQIVDSIRTFRDRLGNDIGGGHVTYLEYMDATHDFLAYTWHESERSEALKMIKGLLGMFMERGGSGN